MEYYLDNFIKIHSKEIKLHKEIANDNILVFPGEFRKIYIIDRSDLDGDINNNINFYVTMNRIPRTIIVDTIIPISWSSNNYIIYPYLEYKTQNEMLNETINEIRKQNKFIKLDENCELSRASIMILLNKSNDNYTLDYWCNEKILENMYAGKREIFSNTIKYLASLEKTNQIIKQCHNDLNKIMNITENQYLDNEYDFKSEILKDKIKLFNYQKQDILWMKEIENMVKNGNNIIEYTTAISCKVINNRFVLFCDKIFSNWMIDTENHIIRKRLKFHGGSIISELGLGKTLTVLFYIINECDNNSNQHNYFIEYKKTCNYFYKRGKLIGQSCEKEKLDFSSLYCRQHKTTPFCDKRAVIYKNLDQFNIKNFINNVEMHINTNSNLIICPNHLCDQWVREFYEKFTSNKRVLMIVTKDQWNNVTFGDILFSDIIITSYNLLSSEWYTNLCKRQSDNVLKCFIEKWEGMENIDILNSKNFTFNLFNWDRVVLDEIHEINQRSHLFSDIKNLRSNFVWNVSGTPFANGLFGYLNLMSLTTNLNTEILDKRSFNTSDLLELGLDTSLIKSSEFLFRRNTKESVKWELQENIIQQHINLLDFTENERNIYNSYSQEDRTRYINFLIKLCCDCQLSNNKLISSSHTFEEISKIILGENNKQIIELSTKVDILETDITNMTGKLELYENQIARLEPDSSEWFRLDYEIDNLKNTLASSRRNLTKVKQNYESHKRISNYLQNSIHKIHDQESCTICLEDIPINHVGITKCGHKFCWQCIRQLFEINGKNDSIKCPNCNELLKTNEIFLLKQENAIKITSELDNIIKDVRSTKIGNIIHFLKDKKDDKFIIFSQWDEILQKVGRQLKKYKFNPVYCNGSVYNRKRSIEAFKKDPKTNIIMLSSKYAASGINLVESHNIILIEPIYGKQDWRTNIENQAIGRANRIGQHSKINVWRFIIKDTIEEEILNNTISDKDLERINTEI